ncbi:uncharacterized protein LOC135218578 isoform X2 [Macrobrachium nipponense]|uniref:uncharacterized protein LOC135218578 isoform X2 n=1 Tax=Macrobrachium nipponense TaxID=159736 RepID=UPI0030C837BD
MAEAFVKMFDAAPSSLVADSPRTRASPTHYVYIELEDEVISQLRVLQEALSEEAMKFDLEEIDILHAHITLGVFDLRPCMQEYSEESLDCLKRELLLEVMEDRPSFQANFLSLGHFSGKFLYVEIERSQDLLDLRSKVVDTFEKHGIPCTDKRPYAPHITLFKGSMRTTADEETKLSLREFVSSIELPDMKPVWVDAVHIREIGGRK